MSRISIRGVESTGETTVGLYYDETPVTGPAGTTQDSGNNAADLNLFDVNGVEVLRGPQGTLYGSGSMGGTLRVIFNKPDPTRYAASTEGQFDAVDGGGDGGYAKAMIKLPLVKDKLALRVVGYNEDRPGYIDDTRFGTKNANNSESKGARILLGYTPTPNIKILGTFIYQKQTAANQQGWYPSLGAYKTESPVRLPFDSDLKLFNLTATWDLKFATLTGAASYYSYDILRTIDFTQNVTALANAPAYCSLFNRLSTGCSTPQMASYTAYGLSRTPAIGYQPAPLESRNDELRLSSNGRGPVQWTLGGYLEDRHDHIVSNIASANPSTGEAYLPLEDLSYRYINTYTRQTAEFSEISYTPLSDLTLTFGARHYSYTKRCRDCSNHRDSCDLPARKAPAHPAHRADFPKDPWAGRRDSNP